MMAKNVSTGFWVSDDNYISGPRFFKQVRIEDNKIIVSGCDKAYSLAQAGDTVHILHNNRPTGFYIDKYCANSIFGPLEKLPWEDHLDAINKTKKSN